jgi:hypothetical protein
MFQPVLRQLFMADPIRGYRWRSVGATERGEVEIAALTMEGREIPYEFRVDGHVDDDGEWYDLQLGAFGYSVAGAIKYGLGRVDFTSEVEREADVLVAIEATLAWLPGGRGVHRGDGYNRSTFKGVQYTLSDFGPYFDKAE